MNKLQLNKNYPYLEINDIVGIITLSNIEKRKNLGNIFPILILELKCMKLYVM